MSFLATVGTVLGVLVVIAAVVVVFGALLAFVTNAYKH